jgi:alkanesulfonate monooxygenase SsuD/methylene tetrahydromethanopterin reductase-like flavin-dependent oxidoreductase (luciferase family)
MMAKKLEFGLAVIDPKRSWPDTVAYVRHVEQSGFDSVCMWDHPHFGGIDVQTGLAALAQATRRIRLWANIMAVPYRPPSIVAKFAASLDYISNGRFILGLGTGWDEREFRALGIPFEPKPVRNRQVIDQIRIARAMWTEERASYRGETWSISEVVCEPKPVQKPGPPIWVGTHGGPKMMREVVIPLADGVNIGIPSNPDAPPLRSVVSSFRQMCAEEGRDPDDFTISVNTLILGATEGPDLSKMYSGHIAEQKMIRLSERQRLVDHFSELAEVGVSHFMMGLRGGDPVSGVSELEEIIAPLRNSRQSSKG